MSLAKFPHSPILHYACGSLLTENNVKNNATAVGLYAGFCCFFVVKQRTIYIEPHAHWSMGLCGNLAVSLTVFDCIWLGVWRSQKHGEPTTDDSLTIHVTLLKRCILFEEHTVTSASPTTVLLGTILTRTIQPDGPLSLLGSNHLLFHSFIHLLFVWLLGCFLNSRMKPEASKDPLSILLWIVLAIVWNVNFRVYGWNILRRKRSFENLNPSTTIASVRMFGANIPHFLCGYIEMRFTLLYGRLNQTACECN